MCPMDSGQREIKFRYSLLLVIGAIGVFLRDRRRPRKPVSEFPVRSRGVSKFVSRHGPRVWRRVSYRSSLTDDAADIVVQDKSDVGRTQSVNETRTGKSRCTRTAGRRVRNAVACTPNGVDGNRLRKWRSTTRRPVAVQRVVPFVGDRYAVRGARYRDAQCHHDAGTLRA